MKVMKTNGVSLATSRLFFQLPFLLCAILPETRVDAFASRSLWIGLDLDAASATGRRHRNQQQRLVLPSSNSDDVQDDPKNNNDRNRGILVLLTVPLAWGTFEPVIRYVYAIEPPIPGLVFSPCYYLVAASALSLLSFLTSTTQARPHGDTHRDDKYLSATTTAMDENSTVVPNNMLPILGGMELGFYLVMGNSLQVLGLKTLNADRVAFLIQLTTIFVPIVQGIAAGTLLAIPARTWIACSIALGGVAVIGLEGNEDVLEGIGALDTNLLLSSSGQLLSQGDLLVMGSALAYTFHCIRLEKYAKLTRAVTLASYKAITETVLSVLLVIGLLAYSDARADDGVTVGSSNNFLADFCLESGQEISSFLATFPNRLVDGSIPSNVLVPAIAAILWTGLVTVAYTIYAQSYGQSRVSPSDANLIYTFQPVWTSLLAFLLLGETLGPAGFLGGALIGLAVFLVISEEQPTTS